MEGRDTTYTKKDLHSLIDKFDEELADADENHDYQKHTDDFTKKLTNFIKDNHVSEKDFKEVASKFKGLDLVYSDFV